MTTAAPLPRLGDLTTAFVGGGETDAALARPWLRGEATPIWLARSAWSLAALVAARRATTEGRAARLWLPDYFCNQSTAPARGHRAELTFYPIGDDLRPDWTACRRMAETTPPDLFVLVHYFGAATPTIEALAFCRSHGALLIEDAAHVLMPAAGIGEAGDAVLFSPHKLLPIPDGALLLVKGERLFSQVSAACRNLGASSPSPWPWTAKRLVQKAMPEALSRHLVATRSPSFREDPLFQPMPPLPRASGMGRRLAAVTGRDLDRRAARMRRHVSELTPIIDGFEGLKCFAPAARAAAPYRLVIECRDEATAAKYFASWRRRGIPVETWPDLAPEIMASPERHRVALDLRRRLLFLPLHQSLASLLSATGS